MKNKKGLFITFEGPEASGGDGEHTGAGATCCEEGSRGRPPTPQRRGLGLGLRQGHRPAGEASDG